MRQPPGRRTAITIQEAQRGLWDITDYLSYVNGQVLELDGAGALTSVGVTHNLGRVPEYFQVVSQDGDGSLWRQSGDPWTTVTVTFRGASGVTYKVRVW